MSLWQWKEEWIGMSIALIITVIAFVYTFFKCKSYKAAFRGLLYYEITENGNELSDEKLKELQKMAMEQMLREFFHKN